MEKGADTYQEKHPERREGWGQKTTRTCFGRNSQLKGTKNAFFHPPADA